MIHDDAAALFSSCYNFYYSSEIKSTESFKLSMEFDEQKSSCWTFPDCLERKIDSLGFYFLKKKERIGLFKSYTIFSGRNDANSLEELEY